MGSRRSTLVVLLVLVGALFAAACSGDEDPSSSASTTSAPERYAVGTRTERIVNEAAPLVGDPVAGGRELATTVFYPATGPSGASPAADAAPDRAGGPFPLIVFSHGLGGSPEGAAAVLSSWAGAGYVVAAPAFPNTSTNATGGIDPGDYANQPGDVSAVISSVLEASEASDTDLSGLVDPGRVGVAGHSLGGITTLGVSANTCCRDDRIGAVVVMAGDPLTFPGGTFELDQMPPLLLVHGTEDDLVTYDASVDVFNDASAPKGLLTIDGGDHGAPLDPSGDGFEAIVATTTDFFDGYLKGDEAAIARLGSDGDTDVTNLVFVAEPGAVVTIPTGPDEPARDLVATVTPDTGLVGGQIVTVSWSGFTPGNTINIVQCSNRIAGDASACDLRTGKVLQPNPSGSGSLPLEIVVGPVGTGVCDSTTPDCQIVFNDGGSLDPEASVRVSVSFAP